MKKRGRSGVVCFFCHEKEATDILRAQRTRYSAKPEAIRRIIQDISPGPYLELFGRHVASGWTVFGNEIERTMFDFDVAEVGADG